MGKPERIDQNVPLPSFHSLVTIETTDPAQFRGFDGLPVHDDNARAHLSTHGHSKLLVQTSL